jgi:hypothetical protein
LTKMLSQARIRWSTLLSDHSTDIIYIIMFVASKLDGSHETYLRW